MGPDERAFAAQLLELLAVVLGFMREVIWLGVVVAIIALVLLDGIALFGAHQSVGDSADAAALEARNTYYETQNVAQAELAAQAYLEKSDKELTEFKTSRSLEGALVFNVSATGHAETYAFKYLSYVGLDDWVDRMVNPATTRSSS